MRAPLRSAAALRLTRWKYQAIAIPAMPTTPATQGIQWCGSAQNPPSTACSPGTPPAALESATRPVAQPLQKIETTAPAEMTMSTRLIASRGACGWNSPPASSP